MTKLLFWVALSFVGLLGIFFGWPWLLGMKIGWGAVTKGGQHTMRIGRAPLMLVELIFPDRTPSDQKVGIWTNNEIYSALGISGDAFVEWEDKYGFDSLGIGNGGELFVPGSPVFS